MAAITTSETIGTSSGIADVEEIRAAFTEHRRELTWLAEFLTDDKLMASACVADARNLTDNNEDMFIERNSLILSDVLHNGRSGAVIRA